MSLTLRAGALAVLIAVPACAAQVDSSAASNDDALAYTALPYRPGHRLYINFDGATIVTAASDDATLDQARVPYDNFGYALGSTWPIPGFDLDAQRLEPNAREVIAAKVRPHFAEFNVEVVTARPTAGDYTMVVVGGDVPPEARGQAGGLATFDCADANPRSVAFCFSKPTVEDALNVQTSVGEIEDLIANCIAHEAGHAFGLHHALEESSDLMSEVGAPGQYWRDSLYIGDDVLVSRLGVDCKANRIATTYRSPAWNMNLQAQNGYVYLLRLFGPSANNPAQDCAFEGRIVPHGWPTCMEQYPDWQFSCRSKLAADDYAADDYLPEGSSAMRPEACLPGYSCIGRRCLPEDAVGIYPARRGGRH